MNKIYDCFLYNNEVELLSIRLNLLSNLVDKFVISWSPYTFTGLKKNEPFPYDLPVINKLSNRIEVIVLDQIKGQGAWERETFSRNELMKGLVTADPDDTVIISDVDEIPRPSSLVALLNQGVIVDPVTLIQDYYNFKFNYQHMHGRQVVWAGPVVQRRGSIFSLQNLRAQRWELMRKPGYSIDHAGWHFSYLTKSQSVEEKLKHFSHQETDIQMRATVDVEELISQRLGFHDHLHAGSVWAVREISSLKCKELENLICNYPEFIATDPADSEQIIREKIRWSIWELYAYEKSKILRSCAARDVGAELIRRLSKKMKELVAKRLRWS